VAGKISTDFETYREIMSELTRPISGEGLDDETLKRLYESKLVYLENLREKCFWEMNINFSSHFCASDHMLILEAIRQTRAHLRDIILMTILNNIARRKVS
jgi:hypothetical protein